MVLSVGNAKLVSAVAAVKLSSSRVPVFGVLTPDSSPASVLPRWTVAYDALPELLGEVETRGDGNSVIIRHSIANRGDKDVLLDWTAPLWWGTPGGGWVEWSGIRTDSLKMVCQPLWMGGGHVVDLSEQATGGAYWTGNTYWMGSVGSDSASPALTFGIADWANSQVRLSACVSQGNLNAAIVCELSTNRQGAGCRLKPGAQMRINAVCLSWAPAFLQSLDEYVGAFLRTSGIRLRRRPFGGVFSGYGMSARPPRPERVSDADFIARMLGWVADAGGVEHGISVFKTQFSRFSTGPRVPYLYEREFPWPRIPAERMVEHIVQHGFVSEYYDLKDRAPLGVKKITEGIRARGFIPGFDSRPYLNLDATDPENDGRVAELYRRIVRDWGYDYLMFDFISTDFESADDTRTMSQAVHERLSQIRRAVGDDVFLEACMCMLGPVVGVADGFRPAQDWRPGVERKLAQEFASRHFAHGSAVQNDMEFVDMSLRPACWDAWNNQAMHSLERVRTMVSLSAMTGFSTLIGGFLDETSEERWRIFTRCLPVAGQPGRPLDYPEHDPPRIWMQQRSIAGRTVHIFGLFNWEERNRVLRLEPLKAMRQASASAQEPQTSRPLALFDFWNQKALIGAERPYEVVLGPLESVILLVCELAGPDSPTYLGTDRHLLGDPGNLEISYDRTSGELKGRLRISGDPRVALYFHLPAGLTPDPQRAVPAQLDLELPQADIMRLVVKGESGTDAQFAVRFTTSYHRF